MLLKDVLNYIDGSSGERSGSRARLAEILGVSGAAVSQWGMRLPQDKAESFVELIKRPDIIEMYDLRYTNKPVFNASDYLSYKENRISEIRKNEIDQRAKLNEKYGSKAILQEKIAYRSVEAQKALDRADRQKTYGNKVTVLTTFIKKLIK